MRITDPDILNPNGLGFVVIVSVPRHCIFVWLQYQEHGAMVFRGRSLDSVPCGSGERGIRLAFYVACLVLRGTRGKGFGAGSIDGWQPQQLCSFYWVGGAEAAADI